MVTLKGTIVSINYAYKEADKRGRSNWFYCNTYVLVKELEGKEVETELQGKEIRTIIEVTNLRTELDTVPTYWKVGQELELKFHPESIFLSKKEETQTREKFKNGKLIKSFIRKIYFKDLININKANVTHSHKNVMTPMDAVSFTHPGNLKLQVA